MKKLYLVPLYAVVSFSFVLEAKAALAADFEVIANPSVTVNSLSKDEVKQIMLTNQTAWKDGKKIAIITLSPDAAEADGVAKEYMGMTGTQAKKYWLTKVFNGVLAAQPPVGDTPEEVAEKVASTPGAIGIVPKGSNIGKAKKITQN